MEISRNERGSDPQDPFESPAALPSDILIEQALTVLPQAQGDQTLVSYVFMESIINRAMLILCLKDKFKIEKALCHKLLDQVAERSMLVVEAVRQAELIMPEGKRKKSVKQLEKYLLKFTKALGDLYQELLKLTSEASLLQKAAGALFRDRARKELQEVAKVLDELESDEAFTMLGQDILHLAIDYNSHGRKTEAENFLQLMVDNWTALLGPHRLAAIWSNHRLAELYWAQGRLPEAEKLETLVLERCRKTIGVDHPMTITSTQMMAAIYDRNGMLTEAAALQESVVKKRQELYGEAHAQTLQSKCLLAKIYRKQGNLIQARKLAQFCVQTFHDTRSSEDPATLLSMHRLAQVYWKEKRFADAEELEKTVIEKNGGITGQREKITLVLLAAKTLALIYRDQGQFDKAEEWDELFERNRDAITDFTPELHI